MADQAFEHKRVLAAPGAAQPSLPPRALQNGAVFYPRNKGSVSNEPSGQTSFYVNGANTSTYRIHSQAQQLADMCGTPVHLIENSSERPLRDFTNVLRGARSSSLGMQVEPSCGVLINAVRAELAAGREVLLHGFSQGGVIIQNALWEMAKAGELGANAAARIHVRTYGSRVAGWPKGVTDVLEYSHAGDKPAHIIERATGRGGKPAQLLERKPPSSVMLPGREHDFHSYLSEVPSFLVRSANSPEELAGQIAASIGKGRFSDAVHREAISVAYCCHGKAFLDALESHSQARGPQRTIGRFVLPSEAELPR